MQKITTFLWFNKEAESAAKFYLSIFKKGKLGAIQYYKKGGPGKEGTVMTVSFELEGSEFVALNGGPIYQFNPAISLYVKCADQKEIDYFWDKLSAGGKIMQCGWLTDKYGITWQIVPTRLEELLQNKDAKKAENVYKAMLKMIKLDIAELERAYVEG